MITTTFNPNKKELINLAAKKLSSIFSSYKDFPLLFLSSGGSCLEILNENINWSLPTDFTVSVLDERWTSNLEERNFENLKKTLFFENLGSESKIINPNISGLNFLESAKQFNFEIKNWILDNPNGKIFITQGIGEDGHTAGILPMDSKDDFERIFLKSDALANAVVYGNPGNKYQERITLNLKFLESFVDNSVVFVENIIKEEIVKEVLENESDLNKIPACIINKLKQVDLFLSFRF